MAKYKTKKKKKQSSGQYGCGQNKNAKGGGTMRDNIGQQIGNHIKELRMEKGWTLKELGQKSNLSTGYLSLVERGLTSINITSLQNVAAALGVDIGEFFEPPQIVSKCIVRSHERPVYYADENRYICFSLAGERANQEGVLEPMIAVLRPEERGAVCPAPHKGEEFCIVMEGVATLILDKKEYELYPGDSYHIMSDVPHCVCNFTNKLTHVLYVNTPKFFSKEEQK